MEVRNHRIVQLKSELFLDQEVAYCQDVEAGSIEASDSIPRRHDEGFAGEIERCVDQQRMTGQRFHLAK